MMLTPDFHFSPSELLRFRWSDRRLKEDYQLGYTYHPKERERTGNRVFTDRWVKFYVDDRVIALEVVDTFVKVISRHGVLWVRDWNLLCVQQCDACTRLDESRTHQDD